MTDHEFLRGGGRSAELIARTDWSGTSLGPIGTWPAALKVAVGMMVNSRFPKLIVWGPDRIAIYNDGYRLLMGDKPDGIGRPLREMWPEIWDEIEPLIDKAYCGEAIFLEDMPLTIDRFGRLEEAWFTFCYSPIRNEHGAIVGMMDTVIETTRNMLAERDTALMNAELVHRIKNVLAMVNAIASQTFRSVETLEEARGVFSARIAALAQAQDSLTHGTTGSAPLRTVIEGALAPHRPPQSSIGLSGPEHLQLSARTAQSLALAINELATNAVKYGSLSTSTGTLTIRWSEDGDQFILEWIEIGGPPVVAPSRRGFGTRLVEQIVPKEFGGTATHDYAAQGVRYRLVAPLDNLRLPSRAAS